MFQIILETDYQTCTPIEHYMDSWWIGSIPIQYKTTVFAQYNYFIQFLYALKLSLLYKTKRKSENEDKNCQKFLNSSLKTVLRIATIFWHDGLLHINWRFNFKVLYSFDSTFSATLIFTKNSEHFSHKECTIKSKWKTQRYLLITTK